MVISAQLKWMRTNNPAFDRSMLNPFPDDFNYSRDLLNGAVGKKKKEKEDPTIVNIVAKPILPTLDGGSPSSIQLAPFTNVRLAEGF
jgi:hypothetical protein